ncbi:hypothetical protein [Leptolyngbya sp. 7M]|uniref:hypothetical protein n=1 Tax=Leptolyngbya sp. 7M TaxID=2812896 RepID=UPI001B8C9DEF|nr:hypothetical protein [Leptolyngbya sp. 7M]QYO65877.1 hypothetical protein JVX88_03510 [Leptolyngbya sp. 7M]
MVLYEGRLSRFDGSRFVTYAIVDTNSPPGTENIYETRDGVYWISTTRSTYRFDPSRTSQPESDPPRLNAQFVTNSRGMSLQDRNGVLWLASTSLFRLADIDGKQAFVPVPLDIQARSNATFTAFELAEASDGVHYGFKAVWV